MLVGPDSLGRWHGSGRWHLADAGHSSLSGSSDASSSVAPAAPDGKALPGYLHPVTPHASPALHPSCSHPKSGSTRGLTGQAGPWRWAGGSSDTELSEPLVLCGGDDCLQPPPAPWGSAGRRGRDVPGLELRGGHVAPAATGSQLPAQPLPQQRVHLRQALLELQNGASVAAAPLWHQPGCHGLNCGHCFTLVGSGSQKSSRVSQRW